MTTLQRKKLREQLRVVLNRLERRLLSSRVRQIHRARIESQINGLERAITAVNHGHYGFCHYCKVPFTVVQMMIKPWGSYHDYCKGKVSQDVKLRD